MVPGQEGLDLLVAAMLASDEKFHHALLRTQTLNDFTVPCKSVRATETFTPFVFHVTRPLISAYFIATEFLYNSFAGGPQKTSCKIWLRFNGSSNCR